jgi:hypothetical protein
MSGSISKTTLEEFYSGTWSDIKDVLRVLNIGEGKMSQVTQELVENYQEMVDRDLDALLADVYAVPIRAYNQVIQGGSGSGTTSVPGWMDTGSVAILAGESSVTVSGKAWPSIPISVVASVTRGTGAFNLYATVDNSSITADGFTATLSAEADAGYFLSYVASREPSTQTVVTGATIKVFPGDVRRAARYWTAGQILVNEFQQLEANITEQATQMVSDARMQVYAMSRPNHRIPGQRRKSNISRFMPANLQPSSFPERPS